MQFRLKRYRVFLNSIWREEMRMGLKHWKFLLIGIVLVFSLAACGTVQQTESNTTNDSVETQESSEQSNTTNHATDSISESEKTEASDETQNDAEEYMHLFIGDTEVSVAWEDNESVSALLDLAKAGQLIIEMSMYGGFEQVGSLGSSLPRNDKQTTTESGDIVLYSGNQVVIFYGSNSWAYTRLGRITDKTVTEMTELLGNGNVAITISYGGEKDE